MAASSVRDLDEGRYTLDIRPTEASVFATAESRDAFMASVCAVAAEHIPCLAPKVDPDMDPFILTDHPESEIHWNEDSKGLVLLCPGLGMKPTTFNPELMKLRERLDGRIDIKAVENINDGVVELEVAAKRIADIVKHYAERFKGVPICLFGTSNGGRIVASVEYQLRETASRVHVITLGTPFFGTKFLDHAEALLGWWQSFIPEQISELIDMESLIDESHKHRHGFGNAEGKDLISKMQKPLPEGCFRSYVFAASPHDELVHPVRTSFPRLPGKDVEVKLFPGASHVTLLAGKVSEELVGSIVSFMETHADLS